MASLKKYLTCPLAWVHELHNVDYLSKQSNYSKFDYFEGEVIPQRQDDVHCFHPTGFTEYNHIKL